MGEHIKKLVIFFLQLLPLGNAFVLESHPDFSDNTWALYRYMLKKGVNKRYKLYWALHADFSGNTDMFPKNVDFFYLEAKGLRQKWKRFIALYFSRYFIDCNAYIHKRRRGQYRLHLGHGMPIKLTPDYNLPEKVGVCDGYLVTGTFWIPIYSEQLHVPKTCLLPLGYPRNDVLISMAGVQGQDMPAGNYLMWLPTYRQHRRYPEQMERDMSAGECGTLEVFPYGMPQVQTKEQLQALNQVLKEWDTILYFRPHPVQDLSHFGREDLSHIVLADDCFLSRNHFTLYGMLAGAKGLITDYSSVYYDFLLTERPIGLTIGDRINFFEHYGCPFDELRDYIKGYEIESFESLLDFVRGAAGGHVPGMEQLLELKMRYHSYPEGGASERIYQYIKDNWLDV